jgi:hydroxypyruvate isomerase
MKFSANLSLLFKELPLLERFAAARRAGFDAVEIQSPYAESCADLQRAAQDAALPVVLINAPVIPNSYPSGFAGRPEMREEFRAQLPLVREYADALQVSCIHVLGGVCAPQETNVCRKTYAENLLLASQALKGRQVVTEFINPHDMPGYLNPSLAVARAIIGNCAGQVRLQFDLYHAARTGLDIAADLKSCLAEVAHIQFADAPGRHEPGTGSTPFADIVKMLASSSYGGYLGAEYNPTAGTELGLNWLSRWRRKEYS